MIVGITGLKGSGKDTAAGALMEMGYIRVAFADKLKDAVSALLNLSVEDIDILKNDITWVEVRWPLSDKPVSLYSFREFLQRFGTEMGRGVFGENFWLDQWKETVFKYTPEGTLPMVVTPDVRFANEALLIKRLGGGIIEIERPGLLPDGHASEQPIPRDLIDARIINNDTIEKLHESVREVITWKEATLLEWQTSLTKTKD